MDPPPIIIIIIIYAFDKSIQIFVGIQNKSILTGVLNEDYLYYNDITYHFCSTENQDINDQPSDMEDLLNQVTNQELLQY